jgi:hypothetical protein
MGPPRERPRTASFCGRHRGRLAGAAAAPFRFRGGCRRPRRVPRLCADPAPGPKGGQSAGPLGRGGGLVRSYHASAGAVSRHHPPSGLSADRPRALGRRAPTGREPAGRAPAHPVRNTRRAHQHRCLLLVLPLGRLRLAARQPLGRDHGPPRLHLRPTGAPCRGASWTPRPATRPGLHPVRRSAGRSPQLGWAHPLGGFFPLSPNLFWPQDHAWCVASEIDLYCTLVAGSEALAQTLVGDPRLEAWRVGPADPIAFDSDQINT